MTTNTSTESEQYMSVQMDIAIDEVVAERHRQAEKHPGKTLNCPEISPYEKMVVLMEEVGEAAHELTYDSEHKAELLYQELTQIAALAVAWMEGLQEHGQ